MELQAILKKFSDVASNPSAQKSAYLAQGKKIVLTAPVYTPEELIHAMGGVPMGAWGGDLELQAAKQYFPAFICSIMQSIVELGMKGAYNGVSAIVIPSLCDSLKVFGENWKYAVPSIPFIPMTYPQNRKPDFGVEFTKAGYLRVISDLEKATGLTFSNEELQKTLIIYNKHNEVMREVSKLLSSHSEITCRERSDIFKSAFFMLKEEHTALVESLIKCLKARESDNADKTKIYTTGILVDAPALLQIFDDNNMQIVGNDVAAESRQYRTDSPISSDALQDLAMKFSALDDCSVLYNVEKSRVTRIVNETKQSGAKGVIVVLTKFCDPEEFDYPLIKKACDAESIPCLLIEVDRQMTNYEQARTAIETFNDLV